MSRTQQGAVLKYSLFGPLCQVRPDNQSGIIDFKVGNMPQIKQGAFLTTNPFDAAEAAQEALSITYSPRFEWQALIKDITSPDITLVNPLLRPNNPSRVWPAFGKTGGGCEIILTEGSLAPKASFEKFPEGGRLDRLRQSGAVADEIFVLAFVESAVRGLQGLKGDGFGENVEQFGAKFIGGDIQFAWQGRKTGNWYCVSCSYRTFAGWTGPLTQLKFWGVVWRDDEGERTRLLSSPTTIELTYPENKASLETNRRSEIDSLVMKLADRMIVVGQHLPPNVEKKAVLPPMMTLEDCRQQVAAWGAF